MEQYNNHHYQHHLSESSGSKGTNFLYGGPVLAPTSSVYGRTSPAGFPISGFHLQSGDHCYDRSSDQHSNVKTEGAHTRNFQYNSAIRSAMNVQDNDHESSDRAVDDIKAKIIAHPNYSNLLEAYMDCQKVRFISYL